MDYDKAGRRALMVNGKHVGWFEATGDTETDLQLAIARIKELGYEAPDLPQWMRIRQQAMDFRDACGLIMNYDQNERGKERRPLSVPYIVNSAFCIELYLKALSLRHGCDQRGHDLLKIYERLPPGAKIALEDRVKDAQLEVDYSGNTDIKALLSVIKDNFLKWRYLHEHGRLSTVSMPQLRFLRALLHRACLN
ncbi:hypothetical protein JR065_20845 [Xanthomonas sp. AmX2]|uniref:hypothetical protein n=1 Tax=Xanthomonas sp. TaxID=29446 RepID=UPI00197DDE81|nr:hypothetical protein [Xanthomonas sp.]MBN6152782.1 hypothetical protein [Xanthomonas sp.]